MPTRDPGFPWLVTGTACIGAFIGQLDASIVQLALPALETAFDAPLRAVTWVAVAYALAFAASLPIHARIAEMTGRRPMYIVGFALFGVASALCAVVPSLPWLIACRVLQGFGGAMLGANGVVILVTAAGPAWRGKAMGIFAAAQAVGVSVGPALGGIILSGLSWEWVFLVNVPLALAGSLAAWLIVPANKPATQHRGFDWRGAVLLAPALTALLLALSEMHVWGPSSATTLTCVAAALLLFAAFVWQENRTDAPLIDLTLFRSCGFACGVVAAVLSYALLYGMFFCMSYVFVRGYHETPLSAGLHIAIVPIALGLVAPFSGQLYERSPRLVMAAGMALCVGACLFLHMLLSGTQGSLPGVMAALAAFGIGLGMFIAPNNAATLSAAPTEKSGTAGGLLNLMRVFGTGLGVAAASSVLGWRLSAGSGGDVHTALIPEPVLLSAVADVLLMLAVFAAIAAAATLWSHSQPDAARAAPA